MFRIGDEIGRNITAVELHTFHILGLELEAFGFFDGNNAVFTDLVHHLSDQLADGAVLGGDGGDIPDFFFSGDFDRLGADPISDCLGGGFDTAFEQHRVGASGQVF